MHYRRAVVIAMVTPSIDITSDKDLNLWIDLMQSVEQQLIESAAPDSAEPVLNDIRNLLLNDASTEQMESEHPPHETPSGY